MNDREKMYYKEILKSNIKPIDYVHMLAGHPLAATITTAGAIKYRFFPKLPGVRQVHIHKEVQKDNDVLRTKCNGKTVFLYNSPSAAELMGLIFIEQEYRQLNVKDKYVLDLGATIGDSAIYFLLKGAKLVWAYEPEKWMCKLAEKNLALNHLNGARIFAEPASSKTIDMFAEKFKEKPKALKIDCEGAEYEMIFNAKRLQDYDEIMLEYHYGYLNLEAELKKQNFRVLVEKPHLGFNERGEREAYGLMRCIRTRINLRRGENKP